MENKLDSLFFARLFVPERHKEALMADRNLIFRSSIRREKRSGMEIKMKAKYLDSAKELLCFIEASPTSFHAVEQCVKMLEEHGFHTLTEEEEWKLECGGKYVVTRNGSSLMAFIVPKKKIKGIHAMAAHSDSPCFKLKKNPEITTENYYLKFNVEKYGALILSTWLDRPLSVAGRLIVQENDALVTKLVDFDKDLCMIPNLAIHMNREMNKGVEYNVQTDMLPLFSESKRAGMFEECLAGLAGVEEKEILGSDLYLYPRQKGCFIGLENEFIASPRLDDLQCVFAGLKAICDAEPEEYVDMLAVFDNEEVGSGTRQGAASTFLKDTIERIGMCLADSAQDYHRWIAESFFVSADNAHAVHPNHPEKADPTNRPLVNGGIVIKFHGEQKYTSDAVSSAMFEKLCRKAHVPVQYYHNRSDIAGGSTLGNISTAQLPVKTVDIGLAQLAMHSACETAGTKDTWYLIEALRELYR